MPKKSHEVVPELGAALDYLTTASHEMLQQFELARLNQAGNLRTYLVDCLSQWVATTAEAQLARLLIEKRKKIQLAGRPVLSTPADLLADLLATSKRLERPIEGKSLRLAPPRRE